jgi:ADP-ribose pyrophosphatase YjhB (NUDIX family)
MPTEPNIRVAAVVRNEHREVLLVRHAHRGKPFWTLPGGAPDGCESADAAVVREVEEETGYRIVVDGLVAAGSLRRDRWERPKIELFFAAHPTSRSATTSAVGEVILEARFFRIAELPADLRPREAAALAESALCVPYLDLTFERES